MDTLDALIAVIPTVAVAFVAIWEKFMPDNLSILALLGRRINKDALTEIAIIKKDLQEHKVDDWRNRILDFENSQRNRRKHTKEEFTQVIKICNKDEKYIEKNNLENGECELAMRYIEKEFERCKEEHDFLRD